MNETPEHKPPKSRWRRTAKRLFYTVLLLVILVVATWEITGCWALDKAIEQARAVDPRLTIEEIEASRKVWPDDENGALVLSQIFPQLEELSERVKQNDPEIQKLPIIGDMELPELGRRWDADMSEGVGRFLAQHAHELAVIDQLADYEGGRFPLEIKSNPLFILDTDRYKPFRMAAKMKCIELLRDASSGKNDRVIRHLLAMSTLPRLIDDEPLLVSALVGIALDSLTIAATESSCSILAFSADELMAIDEILVQSDIPNRLYLGMLGERATQFIIGQAMLDGDSEVLGKDVSGGLDRIPVFSGFFRRDAAMTMRIADERIKAADNPDVTMADLHALEIQYGTPSRYSFLSGMFGRIYTRSFILAKRQIAELRAARIALAVERYRIDRRLWPKRLDELVPDYLETIPADPFKDQAMSYLVDDGTVVVYSIGDDETDNGGDVTHHRVTDEKSPTDWGFVLLPPERRNRPPLPTSMPTTQP